MKNSLNIIDANVKNLTALWKTVSLPLKAYSQTEDINYCEIIDSDWPNRLWFTRDVAPEALENAIKTLNGRKLIIPYFDLYGSNSFGILEERGFNKLFEQVGMSKKLDTLYQEDNRLSFKKVENEVDASIWAEIYPKSFGYRISQQTLVNSYDTVHYYLVFFENKPIGTATIFYTENISGIHGVGVIPEMRRKGFAEEIMKFAMNESIQSGAEFATLQASQMGKGIYLRLGFENQFLIKNYWRPVKIKG